MCAESGCPEHPLADLGTLASIGEEEEGRSYGGEMELGAAGSVVSNGLQL